MVGLRPYFWQRKSPTKLKTIAGKNSAAVTIPSSVPFGLLKYLQESAFVTHHQQSIRNVMQCNGVAARFPRRKNANRKYPTRPPFAGRATPCRRTWMYRMPRGCGGLTISKRE